MSKSDFISIIGLLGNLAVIASGNISVDPGVGNSTPKPSPVSADASLTGVFLAQGDFKGGITGANNDKQLVIYF